MADNELTNLHVWLFNFMAIQVAPYELIQKLVEEGLIIINQNKTGYDLTDKGNQYMQDVLKIHGKDILSYASTGQYMDE